MLITAPAGFIRLVVGLPLLTHLGYKALTSLPMGEVPGRPEGAKRERRNQDLRSRVVVFLNEVRRVEEFAQRAKLAGHPTRELESTLRSAQQRMMAAAAQVAKETGRSALATDPPPTDLRPGNAGDVRDAHGVRVLQVQRPPQHRGEARPLR